MTQTATRAAPDSPQVRWHGCASKWQLIYPPLRWRTPPGPSAGYSAPHCSQYDRQLSRLRCCQCDMRSVLTGLSRKHNAALATHTPQDSTLSAVTPCPPNCITPELWRVDRSPPHGGCGLPPYHCTRRPLQCRNPALVTLVVACQWTENQALRQTGCCITDRRAHADLWVGTHPGTVNKGVAR